MSRLSDLVAALLIMSGGTLFVYHLTQIWRFKGFYAYESNHVLLGFELALAVAITIFGVVRLKNCFRGL